MAKDQIWPGDQLEALHACHMLEDAFDKHVLTASFVEASPALLTKATSVHAAIAEMYQAIGREGLDL